LLYSHNNTNNYKALIRANTSPEANNHLKYCLKSTSINQQTVTPIRRYCQLVTVTETLCNSPRYDGQQHDCPLQMRNSNRTREATAQDWRVYCVPSLCFVNIAKVTKSTMINFAATDRRQG